MSDDKQNVESLLKSMREKAEAERKDIRSEAEEKRKEILDNADREAERLKVDAVKDVDREVNLAIAGKMGRARMEAQKKVVQTKDRSLQQVFEKAREKVDGISGDEYRKIISRLIRQAQTFIPGGGTITVRNDDVEVAKKAVADLDGDWKVEGADEDKGTVIITDQSGTRRVDNGFHTRLKRATTALRDEVARALFGSTSKSSA